MEANDTWTSIGALAAKIAEGAGLKATGRTLAGERHVANENKITKGRCGRLPEQNRIAVAPFGCRRGMRL